jgi:hypothetical protein
VAPLDRPRQLRRGSPQPGRVNNSALAAARHQPLTVVPLSEEQPGAQCCFAARLLHKAVSENLGCARCDGR